MEVGIARVGEPGAEACGLVDVKEPAEALAGVVFGVVVAFREEAGGAAQTGPTTSGVHVLHIAPRGLEVAGESEGVGGSGCELA